MAGGGCVTGGAWMVGGCAWQGACVAGTGGMSVTAADGTHPTGMRSCLIILLCARSTSSPLPVCNDIYRMLRYYIPVCFRFVMMTCTGCLHCYFRPLVDSSYSVFPR